MSRADVATATGLTRATVSSLVDQLVAGGLLLEGAPIATARAGRPSVPLTTAPRSVVGLGLEVNVAYLGATLLDLTGEVIDERMVWDTFRSSNPAQVLARVGALGTELLEEARRSGMRVAGASLALPGLVDVRTGRLQVAPNLGWQGLDPVPLLGLGHLPVRVANEAKLAAMAEPATQVPSSFLFATADVGIGAALVVDRNLFLGNHGWNGELGHILIDPDGPPCACGNRGCLEQYAGREALMTAAGLPIDSRLPALLAALRANDGAATAAVGRAARALGSALADFVNLTDVSAVVLGGIFGSLFEWLHDDVLAVLNRRVLSAAFAEVTLVPASAGRTAAMVGGAREVLGDVLANPAAWI
ncbi:MAG: ROK family protein [Promicromonosporaceae bacterium]|nr:ROK family protein [Promicromonosporaceae bacterium]